MLPWPFTRSLSLSSSTTSSAQPSSCPSPTAAKQTQQQLDNQATLATLAMLLEPFKGQEVPSLARTDPLIKQKEVVPITLSKIWMYLPFLATQGTCMTKAFFLHHLFGPPKPSWGIELTLFTAFLREAAAFSHLSSLSRLRAVLDLGCYLPTPKDGIVTPVSFRVKKRGLRGFLAEADAAEDGTRMITGEWVITRAILKRMQSDFAKGLKAGKERVVLYLHGGAYYVMSAETHRYLTISVARYTESRVFAINYRLAPETRFPGQLHDTVSAYMRLVKEIGIPPENIVFAGDSAGGGLVLATLMYLRDEGYPLPSGAILMSPWVDLTMSCESWTTNQPYDYLPQPKTDDHLHPVKCLLGEVNIHKYLTHPYVSPLFGNFKGLPPLLIQAGEAEVLRDEITLLAHKASLAGVIVEHEIYEDCVHVFQAFLFLDASRKAYQAQRQFIRHKLLRLTAVKDIEYAVMDKQILSDAHLVDGKGVAEPGSLLTSPSSESLPLPVLEDEGEGVSSSEEEDGSEETFVASPTDMRESSLVQEVSPPNPLPSSPPSITRPLLRTYASARDLFMSKAGLPSPEALTDRLRDPARAYTTGDSPHKPLHARSSSHPDLRALLEEYEASGPSNITRLVHYSKPVIGDGGYVDSSIGNRRKRAPSFAGQSPGFGFL